MDSGKSASFLSLRSSELLGGLSQKCRCIIAVISRAVNSLKIDIQRIRLSIDYPSIKFYKILSQELSSSEKIENRKNI
jgi:hypothetical protein